jgi:outer membrane protein OmpA-like peptidoglycan-associated protein
MQTFISKGIACFYFLLFSLTGFSQTASKQNTSATVNVIVTDSKKTPLKGEEVLFINTANKTISGRTNVAGKCTVTLPAGSVYTIKLKTLTDTVDYSTMEIPALKQDQFFTNPFAVNIEFEPYKNFTLTAVQFDSNKPTLRTQSYKQLNEIAEYMLLNEDEHYEIEGHTDNVGKEEDNIKLSQQRAETVKNYLVKKGIKANRITAKGYGATKPVADNTTPEGRQKNRRTELNIL